MTPINFKVLSRPMILSLLLATASGAQAAERSLEDYVRCLKVNLHEKVGMSPVRAFVAAEEVRDGSFPKRLCPSEGLIFDDDFLFNLLQPPTKKRWLQSSPWDVKVRAIMKSVACQGPIRAGSGWLEPSDERVKAFVKATIHKCDREIVYK